MTTTAESPTGAGAPVPHAVVGFAQSLHRALDRVQDVPTWSMTQGEEAEALLALDAAEARLAALRMRVLVQVDRDGLGTETGATSTVAWMADRSRQTRAECSAAARLGFELEEAYPATGAALAAGRVNLDQARAVIAAVNRLTTDHDDLPEDIYARAEAHLLDLAERFDAKTLRAMGKRLFEVVCPEAADAAEAETLAREEEKARRKASLSMRDNGDGTHEGHFRLPDLHAAVLRKILETLSAPRRVGDARIDPATGKKLPYPVVLGQALMGFLETIDPKRLPTCSGGPFTIVVTMTLQALRGELQAAGLQTGEKLSPGEARRLACTAGIISMVLGGASVPLDLGTERRLFTMHQRIALAQQYAGCAADNCDRPPSWVEIHHTTPWRNGGRTDLKDGLPFCPPHHHMADHPEHWTMHTLISGGVRFSRRQ